MDIMNIEISDLEDECQGNAISLVVRDPFRTIPEQEAGQQGITIQPTTTHPPTATPSTICIPTPQGSAVETGEERKKRSDDRDWRDGMLCLVVGDKTFGFQWEYMCQRSPVFAYLYETFQAAKRTVQVTMERPYSTDSALWGRALSHVLWFTHTGLLPPIDSLNNFSLLLVPDIIHVSLMLGVDGVIRHYCSEIRSRADYLTDLGRLALFDMASRIQLTSLRAEMEERVMREIPLTAHDPVWAMLNYRDLRYLLTHPNIRHVNDMSLLLLKTRRVTVQILQTWTSVNQEGKRLLAELSPLINFFKMQSIRPEDFPLLFDPVCPLTRYYQEFILYGNAVNPYFGTVEGRFEDATEKNTVPDNSGHSRGLGRSSDTDSGLGGIDYVSIYHMFSWLRPQNDDRQCIVLLPGCYSEDHYQEVLEDTFKTSHCSRTSADSSPYPVVSPSRSSLTKSRTSSSQKAKKKMRWQDTEESTKEKKSVTSVSGNSSVYPNTTPLCLGTDSCQPELVPLANFPGIPGIQHASCVWRNCLYVSGTRSDPTSFHVYRPWQNTWKELARLPQPRLDHGMVALDNRIFVLGGFSPEDRVHNTVLSYYIAEVGQPESRTWETYTELLVGVTSPIVAVLGNLIYVIGGTTQEGCDSEVIQVVNTVHQVVYKAGPVYPNFTSHTARAVSYRGHIFLLHHHRGFFTLVENLPQLQQVDTDLDTYAFLRDAVESQREQSVARATEAGEEGEDSHVGGQRQDSDDQPEGQPDSLREGGVDPSLLSTMAQTDNHKDNHKDNRKDKVIPKRADQNNVCDDKVVINSAIIQKQQLPDCNRCRKQTPSVTKMVCNITGWHCAVFGRGIHQSVCDEAGGMIMRWDKGKVRNLSSLSLDNFADLIKTGRTMTCVRCNRPMTTYPQSETLRDKDDSPLFIKCYAVHCGATLYGPGRRLLAVCWCTQRSYLRCLALYRFTCVPDVFDMLLDFIAYELPSKYDPKCLKYIQSDERQSSSLDQVSVHKNETVKKAIHPHDQCGEMRDSPLQSYRRQPQPSDSISVKEGENRNEPIEPQMDQNYVFGEVLLSAHNPSVHAHAPTKESHSLHDDCAIKGENTATSTEPQRDESDEGEEMKNHVPWYQLPIDANAKEDMLALSKAIDQQGQQVLQLRQFELDCFVCVGHIISPYLTNCVSKPSQTFKDRETNLPLQVVAFHVPMKTHGRLKSTFWIDHYNTIVYIVLDAEPCWNNDQRKVAEELYKIQPRFFHLYKLTFYPVSQDRNPSKHSDRDSHYNEQIYNASHPSSEADSRQATLPKAAPARETRTEQGRGDPASHSWNARSMVISKGTFPRVVAGKLFQHSRDTVRVDHVGRHLHVGKDFSCMVHDHQLLVLGGEHSHSLWVIPFNPDATLSEKKRWRRVEMGHDLRMVHSHSLIFPPSQQLMPTSKTNSDLVKE